MCLRPAGTASDRTYENQTNLIVGRYGYVHVIDYGTPRRIDSRLICAQAIHASNADDLQSPRSDPSGITPPMMNPVNSFCDSIVLHCLRLYSIIVIIRQTASIRGSFPHSCCLDILYLCYVFVTISPPHCTMRSLQDSGLTVVHISRPSLIFNSAILSIMAQVDGRCQTYLFFHILAAKRAARQG